MKKLKFGIIGCGGIATGKHMPALANNPDAQMVAFCDIIEERAVKANDKYADGKAKVFTDYKELLKLDLDAVCVLTPNCSHCEISIAALYAGNHVICEKPMAMNYAEALKMIEARDKSGKLLTIGYQNRFRPDSLYLKKECDQDVLGDIYYARAKAVRRRAVPTWGVFIDEEKQGGGPLIDIGTHALDLTLFMMNNYQPDYCIGTTYHKLNNDKETGNSWGDWDTEKFTAEDSAFGMVVMKNGATINIEASWALNIADPDEAATMICGTKGGADLSGRNPLRINGIKNNTQYITTPDFNASGVAFFEGKSSKPDDLESKCFTDAILGKGKLYVTAEQAACVTRILEGIYKSAKSGTVYKF